MNGEYLIGIDMGGTRIKAVAARPDGRELARAEAQTHDEDGAQPWRDSVAELVADFKTQFGASRAIGLSAPGLASRDARSIAFMPGRLQGLENFDWSDWLGTPVRVLNDAHAALMGEVWQGAAAGKENALMLTLGTGVGGAILCDGRLLRGTIGRAGHLGHITTNFEGAADIVNTPGSLEDAIGECTLPARGGGRFASTRELVDAHLCGDAFATDVWMRGVRALAAGMASLINALDPEVIVLGGGVAAAGEALFTPLGQYLDEMEWRPGGHRVPIVTAVLGDYAGALGAAYYGGRDL